MTAFSLGMRHMALAALLLPLVHAPAQAAPLDGVAVVSLQAVDQRRSGRTTFDYRFEVEIGNDDTSATDVVGTVVSSSPNIVVIEGEAEFGDVEAGTSATSTDTITLRVDRRAAFDETLLSWSFEGEPVVVLGSVGGTVSLLPEGTPAVGATLSLTFPETEFGVSDVVVGADGSYVVENLPFDGSFVIDVIGADGVATGSAEGFLLESDPNVAVDVEISAPGGGTLIASVVNALGAPVGSAIVTAIFPETERRYSGVTDSGGSAVLAGLAFDGTLIVTAFDPASGESASGSTIIDSQVFQTSEIALILVEGSVVNEEFLNAAFLLGEGGLDGWRTSGTVGTIERSEVFDLGEEQ